MPQNSANIFYGSIHEFSPVLSLWWKKSNKKCLSVKQKSWYNAGGIVPCCCLVCGYVLVFMQLFSIIVVFARDLEFRAFDVYITGVTGVLGVERLEVRDLLPRWVPSFSPDGGRSGSFGGCLKTTVQVRTGFWG